MKFVRTPRWLFAVYIIWIVIALALFMVGLQTSSELHTQISLVMLGAYAVFSSVASIILVRLKSKSQSDKKV